MQDASRCSDNALSVNDLGLIDRYWPAASYLSVGQIYLLDNPLLRGPMHRDHIKPRLLGHWSITPALNFIYAHLNRAGANPEVPSPLHRPPS